MSLKRSGQSGKSFSDAKQTKLDIISPVSWQVNGLYRSENILKPLKEAWTARKHFEEGNFPAKHEYMGSAIRIRMGPIPWFWRSSSILVHPSETRVFLNRNSDIICSAVFIRARPLVCKSWGWIVLPGSMTTLRFMLLHRYFSLCAPPELSLRFWKQEFRTPIWQKVRVPLEKVGVPLKKVGVPPICEYRIPFPF